MKAFKAVTWDMSSLHPVVFYEKSPVECSSQHFVPYESPACLWSSSSNLRARSWARRPSARSIWEREGGPGWRGAAVCLLQFSDLPPCRWLPLFAHSVNYYQKAVYLGCSPTLLHILWPIIKGDLHYKPWSPSKKATATVSASGPIPALQLYPSTPSCFVPPHRSRSTSSSHSLFLLIPLLQHAHVG